MPKLKLRGNPLLRSLDRALGIPVLLWLGAFKTRRALPKRIDSIGLLRTACMGDTLLLSALVRDLRQSFPQARLVVFAATDNYEIATLMAPDIEVVRIDVTRPLWSVQAMRREKLDVLIDFGQWPRLDALLTVLARARYTIGFSTEGQFRHRAFDLAVPHRVEVHEIENFRNLIRPLGVTPHHLPQLMENREPLPDSLPQPYVVLHAATSGFRCEVRRWPAEHWAELIRRLTGEGVTVLLSGTRSDREMNQEIIDASGCGASLVCNAAGQYSLSQTIALLRDAAATVSVNTGPMHLAQAGGGTVVALNGPTSPHRWGVLGEGNINIQPDVEGCGYHYLGSEYVGQRLDCMQHISVDRVHAVLRRILNGQPANSGAADCVPGYN